MVVEEIGVLFFSKKKTSQENKTHTRGGERASGKARSKDSPPGCDQSTRQHVGEVVVCWFVPLFLVCFRCFLPHKTSFFHVWRTILKHNKSYKL